ncbi:MAG: methyltransferase domain-containing protein [Chloroflexia bacterium]|nr:methyltransferase domain-containing protein [Chloroflexia bacterium]
MADLPCDLREEAARKLAHPAANIVAAIASLELDAGMHVLDIGCGPGPHLGLFADRVAPGGVVTGLDIGTDLLAIAADLHAEAVANGTVRLQKGDLNRLPFDDASFDVAWMSALLHHIDDPMDALPEMGRVVKPGGLVAVMDGDSDGSFPCLPWPPEFEHVLRTAALRAQRENFGGSLSYLFDGYIGRKLPHLLVATGLTDVSMKSFANVESKPLSAHTEARLCRWFLESFGERVRDFLAPHDWNRLERSFTPGSPDYLPSQPGFFMARMSFLATGSVRT